MWVDGEVDYQLGLCELRQGRPEAALAAWDRIEPSSPYAAPAAVERATVAIEHGRFTLAEKIIEATLEHAAPHDKLRLLQKLAMLFEIEGRTSEMRDALIESWRYSDAPAGTLLMQALTARAGQAAASDSAPVPGKRHLGR